MNNLTNIANRNLSEVSKKISEAIGDCPFEFVVDDVLKNLVFDTEDVGMIEKLISTELNYFLKVHKIEADEERCCYRWVRIRKANTFKSLIALKQKLISASELNFLCPECKLGIIQRIEEVEMDAEEMLDKQGGCVK